MMLAPKLCVSVGGELAKLAFTGMPVKGKPGRCVWQWRGLLGVLPDNKIVEEVHHGLKQDAKKTQKSQRRIARQQSVAVSTPVLSTRDIPHSARVTTDWWIQHFSSTKATGCRSSHYSANHKMPKEWTKVMGPKS